MNTRFLQIFLVLILFSSLTFFRFTNLGHSDFQGDEVSAQNYLFDDQSFPRFLISRDKAPGQYLVTASVNSLFPLSTLSTLFIRLPFAFASVAVVLLVFLAVKRVGGFGWGLLVAMMVSFSGLLIAFSRIAQYQSFVVLCSVGSVLFLINYLFLPKLRWILLTGILGGVGLWFHYDALSYVIPTAIYLLVRKNYKETAVFFLSVFLIAGVFYLPFTYYHRNKPMLKNYLINERLLAGYAGPTNTKVDSVYYSFKLLQVYNSKEYLILVGVGILIWLIILFKFSNKPTIISGGLAMTFIVLRYLSVNKDPTLYYLSIISFLAFIASYIFRRNLKEPKHFFELWFLLSFFGYTILISKPLTHIYTFLLPCLVLSSFGLLQAYRSIPKVITLCVVLALVSAGSFNYQAFIESKREYPFESENYLFGRMPDLVTNGTVNYGLFGFARVRNLFQLQADVHALSTKKDISSYYSNVKFQTIKYYLPFLKYKDKDYDLYVYVKPTDGAAVDASLLVNSCVQNINTIDYSVYVCSESFGISAGKDRQ